MELSTRLAAIAKCVPTGSRIIDVGTDHAYIPIFLMKKNIAKSCLATDINRGPLEKAEHNIKSHNVSGIALMQTNGLDNIHEGAGDVIMISGMGGYLIIDILNRALPLVHSVKKLILQPQKDIAEVRKYLHTIGFSIEDEDFVKDDGKYYTVIVAVQGEERYKEDYEYIYGRCLIQKGLPLYKEWLLIKDEKLQDIYEGLKIKASDSVDKRKQELEAEMSMHREVMKCLF